MKKALFIGLALLSIGAVSCTMEKDAPEQAPVADNMVVLGATLPQTKAAISDEGAFTWQAGDDLSLWAGSSFATLGLTEGAGEKTAQFAGALPEGGEIGDIAIYPAGDHKYAAGAITINLPSEYVYETDNTNIPLVCEVSGDNIVFKAVGGVARFTAGVPNGASKVALVTGKKVTGDFEVTEDGISVAEEAAEDKVVYTFEEVADPVNMVFNFPLPVGEYTMKFQILDAEGNVMKELAGKAAHEIKASDLLIFNELALPNMPVKLNGKYEYNTIAEALAKAKTLTDAESIDLYLKAGTLKEDVFIDGRVFTVPVTIEGVSPYSTTIDGTIITYKNKTTLKGLNVLGNANKTAYQIQDAEENGYNYPTCVFILQSGYGVTIDNCVLNPKALPVSTATALLITGTETEATERDIVKNSTIGDFAATHRESQIYGGIVRFENNNFRGPYSSYGVRLGTIGEKGFDAEFSGNNFQGTVSKQIHLNASDNSKLVLGDGVKDDNKYAAGITNRVDGVKAATFVMMPDKDMPYVNTPQPSVIDGSGDISASSVTEALNKAVSYGYNTMPLTLTLNASDEFAENIVIDGSKFKSVTIKGKGQDQTKLTGSIEVRGTKLTVSDMTIVTSDKAAGQMAPTIETTRDTYGNPYGILIGESGYGSIIKDVTFDMSNSVASAISAIYIAPYTNGFLADEVSGCTFLGTTAGMRHIQAYTIKAKIEGNKFYNPCSSYSVGLATNDADHPNEVTLKGNEFYNATGNLWPGVRFGAGTYVLGDGETDDNVFEEGKFSPEYKANGCTADGFTPAVTIDGNVITVVPPSTGLLTRVWKKYDNDVDWPSAFTTRGEFNRNAVMTAGNVYMPIAGAADGEYGVAVFDRATGSYQKTITSGIDGGGAFKTCGAAKIEDNVFVSNLAMNGADFKVYKVGADAAESVITYSIPAKAADGSNSCRLGDVITAWGTMDNGLIMALNANHPKYQVAAPNDTREVYIWTVKNGVVADTPMVTTVLSGTSQGTADFQFGGLYVYRQAPWGDGYGTVQVVYATNYAARMYSAWTSITEWYGSTSGNSILTDDDVFEKCMIDPHWITVHGTEYMLYVSKSGQNDGYLRIFPVPAAAVEGAPSDEASYFYSRLANFKSREELDAASELYPLGSDNDITKTATINTNKTGFCDVVTVGSDIFILAGVGELGTVLFKVN